MGLSNSAHKFNLYNKEQTEEINLDEVLSKRIEHNLHLQNILLEILSELPHWIPFIYKENLNNAITALNDLEYQKKILFLAISINRAVMHYKNRQYKLAISEGNTALEVIGVLKTKQQGKESLSADFIKKTKANIFNLQALALRAESPEKRIEIIQHFKDALEEISCDAYILSNFAWYLNKIGLREYANKYHKIAHNLSPNDPSIHNGLAFSYFAIGNYSDSELFYRRGLALKPDYIIMANNLAWMLICKSRNSKLSIKEKITLLNEAETILLNNLKNENKYGITHYDFAHSNYYLGIINLERKKFSSALSCFEKAKSYSAGNDRKIAKINDCIDTLKIIKNFPSAQSLDERIPIALEDYPIFFNEGPPDDKKMLIGDINFLLKQIDNTVLPKCQHSKKTTENKV